MESHQAAMTSYAFTKHKSNKANATYSTPKISKQHGNPAMMHVVSKL